MKLGIIDYGVGNLSSMIRACSDLNFNFTVIKLPSDAPNIDYFILPGVGSFNYCINQLEATGWAEVIKEEVLIKEKYILGICIGMHLLSDIGYEGSKDENGVLGLGLLSGRTQSLKEIGCSLSLPHVGWNDLNFIKKNILLNNIPSNIDFYFCHSYSLVATDSNNIIATTNHGIDFNSIVGNENVWGLQFHPEKSSKAGLKILNNYMEMAKC